MKPLMVLVRREFWENRSIFLVLPAVITVFFLLVLLLGVISPSVDSMNVTIDVQSDEEIEFLDDLLVSGYRYALVQLDARTMAERHQNWCLQKPGSCVHPCGPKRLDPVPLSRTVDTTTITTAPSEHHGGAAIACKRGQEATPKCSFCCGGGFHDDHHVCRCHHQEKATPDISYDRCCPNNATIIISTSLAAIVCKEFLSTYNLPKTPQKRVT